MEFVKIFKPEILNNYFTLFYEVRRQLRDMPMKTIFMKMDFLLPLIPLKLEGNQIFEEYPILDLSLWYV